MARRRVKTRESKVVETAISMTGIAALVTATYLYYLLTPQDPKNLVRAIVQAFVAPFGASAPLVVAGVLLITITCWWFAIRKVRQQNALGKSLEELQALSPDAFEEWVEARFRDLGWSTKLSGAQGDHGVDIVLEKQGQTAVVQCKNYKKWSVGEPILRDLFGAMHDFGASHAYLVTTGRLTQAAREWAAGKPITIWDGEYLAALSMRTARETTTPPPTAPAPSSPQPAPAPESTAQPAARRPLLLPRSGQAPKPESRIAQTTAPSCPKCGKPMVERQNRKSGDRFWGCSGYPQCRHTMPMPAESAV